MPLLKIQTNVELAPARCTAILQRASRELASLLGKPESYVMVVIEPGVSMLFGGDDQPLAYLEVKSIGLPEETTKTLSAALCQLFSELLTIPQQRIYIEFAGSPRHMWGWNGTTFER